MGEKGQGGLILIFWSTFWLVFQIYRRCWLVFRKSSSKGPQRLEKYPDEKSVCLRGCPKVSSPNLSAVPLRILKTESTFVGVVTLRGWSLGT